jgi:hypothetical protein
MMATSNVDETMSETEPAASGVPAHGEAVPEAPPAPEFDTTPWPVPTRTWPRALQMRRQLDPRLWTAALAAVLLFTAGGIGLLYLDDTSYQNRASQLSSQNQALLAQHKAIQAQLATTQTNLTATLGELATVKAELEHPTLTIWNSPQVLKDPSWYLAGGIPDTFTYHLNATSNGPMSVSIMTFEQWGKAIECVDYGRGNTNYCMQHSGTEATWTDVRSVNFDFHKAEGCADYLSVFTTSSRGITVTPNVSISYNPAPNITGACS